EWGGEETLESYGVDPTGKDPRTLAEELSAAMPKSHHDFLAGLALTHQEGDYVFVHAGLRPGAPLDEQKEEDLLWIRKRFHNAAPDARPEQVVVHGHTPTDKPDDAGWRIGVDTGAVYGGMLTAVVLEGNARRFLSVKDR
ncbi:MAG: serine/threonine protein phosphatase, partial [Oricola sp.]|nr:serine/threonine protein phosphatase [Oricola sp.]